MKELGSDEIVFSSPCVLWIIRTSDAGCDRPYTTRLHCHVHPRSIHDVPELQGQSDQVRLPLHAHAGPRLRRLLRQRHGSAELLIEGHVLWLQ